MINKQLREQQIQYIAPEDVLETDFIQCNTHDLFKISTHFTRVPREDDPNWDRVYYFIKRDSLYLRLEGVRDGSTFYSATTNQAWLRLA